MKSDEEAQQYLKRIGTLLEKIEDIESLSEDGDRATVAGCFFWT
jgi:hypothetical protein